MSLYYFTINQPILARSTKLLSGVLAGFTLLVGCSNQTVQQSNDNHITLSKDQHIMLKTNKRMVFEEESIEHNSDLWQRLRQGFKLQQTSQFNDKRVIAQTQYFSKHNKSTQKLLGQGSPYLYYIITELEKRDMPLELALVPAIESAYNPIAVSNMKAAGLWQFMPITAKHFKLQQDRWYDGRLDVMASTNAALDYLQYLHNSFSDWPLALAAYNAGEGTVRRAIAENKKKQLPTDYWHLKLPQQTQLYVPKLLALSNIIIAPKIYGITLDPLADEPYFEFIQLDRQVKFSTLSKSSGIANIELEKLNAGYKQKAIINNKSPSHLLVPIVKKRQLEQLLLAGNIPNETISLWNDYKIKQGDSLSTIAKTHKTTVSELRSINKLTNNSILRAGKTIKVPLSTNSQLIASSASTNNKTKSYNTILNNKPHTVSPKVNTGLDNLIKINQFTQNALAEFSGQTYTSDRE